MPIMLKNYSQLSIVMHVIVYLFFALVFPEVSNCFVFMRSTSFVPIACSFQVEFSLRPIIEGNLSCPVCFFPGGGPPGDFHCPPI